MLDNRCNDFDMKPLLRCLRQDKFSLCFKSLSAPYTGKPTLLFKLV